MKDLIENEIVSYKEVLSNLPKNNIKNQKKYVDEVNKILDKYSLYKEDLYKEMKFRYDKIMGINKDISIDRYDLDISNSKKYLYLINPYTTSYEKSGLDIVMYNLSRYYKANLDDVNDNIYKAIEIFKFVGISLFDKDFCYSKYVYEYMSIFLEFYAKDKEKLKEPFEQIYWKCSDILIHLELNFKYLYWKNKKIFDRFYKKKKLDFLQENACDEILYFDKYKNMKITYDGLVFKDINIIIRDYISKKYNISDFVESKIDKCYEDILCTKILDENREIINNNLFKLYNSLIEYKNYSKYILFVDTVKKIFDEKDKYKDSFKNKYKEISKLESKLLSINKKVNRAIKFKRSDKVISSFCLETNNLILELKKLYDELDFDKFNEFVSKLDNNTSIFDILCLVSSNYLFLRKVLKDENDEISDKDVKDVLFCLNEFILSPYNNIINNITIGVSKDIPMIISDRYKLLNLNVSSDSVGSENIDAVIDTVYKILLYDKILNSDISVDDIMFVCYFNSIIKNNEVM